ncbi:MAG: NAD-dependent epimerase/dehydratase family protein [Deltaproteobacteria bacterium]|nr:NAD-dependent epimerase/dehydratase family protein [Deltaproteobacteria bacterium]
MMREIRNILLIGGAGYLGSVLLPKLLHQGFRVYVADILLYNPDIIDIYRHKNCHFLKIDFRNVSQFEHLVRDVDTIIHLGAIVGDAACSLNKRVSVDVNVHATRKIIHLAQKMRIKRFIFASTCSVYGAASTILDEESSLKPLSLYALTKMKAEQLLQNMSSSIFQPTILRFGTLFGVSPRMRFDLVINRFVASGFFRQQLSINGGSQIRPFIHVDDAARCIIKLLDTPLKDVGKQIFNVGCNAQNYSIKQIGEIVRELLPESKITRLPVCRDPRNYHVCFDKIANTLGFSPKTSVYQGIQRIVTLMKNQRFHDYEDPKYHNSEFLFIKGLSTLRAHNSGRKKIRQGNIQSGKNARKTMQTSNVNWSVANLRRVNWAYKDLSHVKLIMANLQEANLCGINLSGADLTGVDLRKANLRGANLSKAKMNSAYLAHADLRNANLSEASFIGANLSDTNLTHSNLNKANLLDANLTHAILCDAILPDGSKAAETDPANLTMFTTAFQDEVSKEKL